MFFFFFFIFFFNTWNNLVLFFGFFMFSYLLFYNYDFLCLHTIMLNFECDSVSYILICLSIWVICLSYFGMFYIKDLMLNTFIYLYLNIFLMIFLILTFSTSNYIFFYFMFECSIIPVFVIILGWGGQFERNEASLYMFFYTFLGSLPLLMIIFLNKNYYGTLYMFFEYYYYFNNNFYFFFCCLGFLIKFPLYSVHYWLLKAHVEAPVSGSMILAGVLLKMGGYGLVRFMTFYQYMNMNMFYFILSLSLVGGVYLSVSCLSLMDMKLLVAMSSVVHMSLCIMGVFLMKKYSISGVVLLMVGHGLCSSGMFYLVNLVYLRTGSRSMFINKGLMNILPSLSLFWFLFCISNISAPPCISLLGEIVLLSSLINFNYLLSFFFFFISMFSAVYSMFLYSFSQHGFFSYYINMFMSSYMLEFFLLFLHMLPLNGFILISSLVY